MAYTVKQVAAMSGVSVRTLHFYDETGLLKPAYHGANGYRFYEEPQLLMLQQILFYRELGFELQHQDVLTGSGKAADCGDRCKRFPRVLFTILSTRDPISVRERVRKEIEELP